MTKTARNDEGSTEVTECVLSAEPDEGDVVRATSTTSCVLSYTPISATPRTGSRSYRISDLYGGSATFRQFKSESATYPSGR